MKSASPLPSPALSLAPVGPAVDVVVPVHNEEAILAASIRRLHDYLTEELAVSWRIVIADNASTDATLRVAMALAEDLPNVELLALTEKGRGVALRAAWERSDAEVVCYMDVDLSTDLRALPPLLAPLFSGHSDVAIGSRLAPGSRVVRGPKRELISRAYNRLLHTLLGARFTDAQCGFKAIRTDAARRLLPRVRDEAWFFDTELLVLAQREGMRIHEVPVDWIEDPDSRVEIVSTALADLRGIARLLAEARLTRFLAIGVVSTIAYALLYLLLRGPLGAIGANALALALTAVANTHANRRLTFRIRGRHELVRQHAAGALVYVLTLGLTTGALAVLHGLAANPSRAVELIVLVAASVCATVTRFMALRSWVFARRGLTPTEGSNQWPPRPSHYPAL
jgi:glycosyltransferase involved in cell wall biosynthesis